MYIVKFPILGVCNFFFVKMGPDGSKVLNDISSERTQKHTRFSPPNSWILMGRVSAQVVKGIVKFKLLNFWQLLFLVILFLAVKMVVNGV